ncbi:hypothetical protein FJZ27_04200 [Candidatus Peribacteria bacterium]|nr:hypothetical protein [Candidatus Peribacteria bacterium]
MPISLRISLLLLSLSAATPALARSITVEQSSATSVYGDWVLSTPNATTIVSHSREQVRTISSVPHGIYTLRVNAPTGATTTLRLKEGHAVRSATTGTSVTFSLAADASITVQIVFTFQGSVTIESTPSGASFELMGPNGMRITGTTPHVVRELAPYTYLVNFGLREGCTLPRPISRELPENGEIRFIGEYRCTSPLPFSASTSSSSSVKPLDQVRVIQSLPTTESTPGGQLRLTLGLINTGKSTLHDITFIEQYDPAAVLIAEVPEGARVEGNQIIWNIPKIYAGQRWSADLRLLLSPSLTPGSTTSLTARASATDLRDQDPSTLSETVQVGAAALPKTGRGLDLLFVGMGMLLSAVLTGIIKPKCS